MRNYRFFYSTLLGLIHFCFVWNLIDFLAVSTHAQSNPIITQVEKDRVRIDGSLREWRGIRFTTIGKSEDASMRYAFAYNSKGLYLGAEIHDESFVRTRHPGIHEDAVILTLAIPKADKWMGWDFWLFAGIPGRQAASASISKAGKNAIKKLRGVKIVEGPSSNSSGYVVETYIPWKLIPNGHNWSSGKYAIRLRDVDNRKNPRVENQPASTVVNPGSVDALPSMQFAGRIKVDQLKAFLISQDLLGRRPRFDLKGDVTSDRRKERISIVSTFIVVTGPGFRNGSSFSYARLPVGMESDIKSARLADLTGDGKKELLVRIRQQTDFGSHELWQVISLADGNPKPVFTIQLRIETSDGFAASRLSVDVPQKGDLPLILLSSKDARGLDKRYAKPRIAGVEPVLLPWDVVTKRVYRWNGHRFELIKEIGNSTVDSRSADLSTSLHRNGKVRSVQPDGTSGFSSYPGADSLIANFRSTHTIPEDFRERFRMKVNLAEDPKPETLVVLGNALLIVGPGFRGGRGYFYWSIPVRDPADVLKVSFADLTGDGRSEIILRIRQTIDDVQRDLLLFQQFQGETFRKILSIEVSRQQGSNRISNRIRLVKAKDRKVLEIHPGRAIGWNATTYPFIAESVDEYHSLLLPWKDKKVRFRFDGQRLVR